MMNLKNYFYGTLSIFLILTMFFIINSYLNIIPSINSVLGVLIGSSLTASLALVLELNKFDKENRSLTLAINSEIVYNKQSLNDNLKALNNENSKIIANISNNNRTMANIPLHPIKTDMWDLINSRMDKNILGKNYNSMIVIVRNLNYIDEHLKLRERYIEHCILKNKAIDSKKLKNYNDTLISNIESAINSLEQLSPETNEKNN